MSYIKEFKSLRLYKLFLEDENLKKLRSKDSFWKEVSEAYGVRRLIRPYLLRDPFYVVVDVGAGKGIFTTLTALMHPKTKVVAIDPDESVKWEHLKNLKNVETYKLSIYSEEFLKLLKGFKKVIMVGIHLCTHLAIRFAQVYNQLEEVRVGVLVPCCVGDYPEQTFKVIEEEIDKYTAWSIYLATLFKGKVKTRRDSRILSPKNILILATKDG